MLLTDFYIIGQILAAVEPLLAAGARSRADASISAGAIPSAAPRSSAKSPNRAAAMGFQPPLFLPALSTLKQDIFIKIQSISSRVRTRIFVFQVHIFDLCSRCSGGTLTCIPFACCIPSHSSRAAASVRAAWCRRRRFALPNRIQPPAGLISGRFGAAPRAGPNNGARGRLIWPARRLA